MSARWDIRTFRAWNTESGVRTVVAAWSVSSWLSRCLLSAAAAAALVLGLILLIPVALVGLAAVGVLAVRAGARRLLGAAHAPNGVLDGRRNVRVITPRPDSGTGPATHRADHA